MPRSNPTKVVERAKRALSLGCVSYSPESWFLLIGIISTEFETRRSVIVLSCSSGRKFRSYDTDGEQCRFVVVFVDDDENRGSGQVAVTLVVVAV